MVRILLIDDNEEILLAVAAHLTGQGFHVTAANTGVKAISYLNETRFDCIILDILLPDLDGFAICKAARTITDTPIIFLTCLDDLDDKVRGLMAGGDDYITKPFSLKELSVRIHVLLRREQEQTVSKGRAVYLDPENRMLHTPEKNIFLSRKEFELFSLFSKHPGRVFSKEELLRLLWSEGAGTGTVAVHVLKLRRKLESAAPYIGSIETDYGAGYSLMPPEGENVS